MKAKLKLDVFFPLGPTFLRFGFEEIRERKICQLPIQMTG